MSGRQWSSGLIGFSTGWAVWAAVPDWSLVRRGVLTAALSALIISIVAFNYEIRRP